MNIIGKDNESLSLIQDPFKTDKINFIAIEYYAGSNKWEARIRFKNGMTDGAQNFQVKGAENLPSIIAQMQAFVNSLK